MQRYGRFRADVVETGKAERKLEHPAVVEQCDFLLVGRHDRLVRHHIGIVHQADGIVLVNDGEIHPRYDIRYDQGNEAIYECIQENP